MNFWKSGWLVAFIFVFGSAIHAQFTDDFSDGDFTNDPSWTGDDSLFVVENEVLRSNRTGAFIYGLTTPSSLVDDAQWQFWVNLNFGVTGANYVDVFVMADNSDLSQVQNGYFIRLGGTPKQIALFSVVGGTENKIIDGTSGQIGSSSNNIFVIRASRTEAGEWTVEADKNALDQFALVGTATDIQTSSASHFGLRITQSNAAGPINNHFFDDFSVAPIPIDDIPPELISAEALSPLEVKLIFDEPLEETSASDPDNYSLTDIGAPTSVEWSASAPDEVVLVLGSPLVSGQDYTVTATGVADPAGNVSSGTSAQFFYYVPGIPEFKSLVFNEIMADPTPVVGLPEAEYLEIFNASDEFFDLNGWIFVNTTTAKTLGQFLIPPGGFVILCDANNVNLFEGYGPTLGISSFVALANAADSLTLIAPGGDIIDIVSYTDTWYGDPAFKDGGYSLELINPYTPCGGASNWKASQATEGGTPGEVNSIFDDTPDTTPPTLNLFTLTAPDRISLTFSEDLDQASVFSANYEFNPDVDISQVSLAAANIILLDLAEPLEVGVAYELTIDGIADCEGNYIAEPLIVSIFIGATPGLHDVLISEIMADPTPSVGLPEGEYFELYNASAQTIELKGCNLSGILFEESSLISPGEYAVFASDQNTTVFFTIPEMRFLNGFSTTFLTNGGRELLLTNAEGDMVDRVSYHLSWYGDASKEDGGYSLERINLDEPCRGKDNWTASMAPKGGTPGMENSVNNNIPDTTPPTPVSLFVRDATHLEMIFSEVIDSLSILAASVEISPTLSIVSIDNISPDYLSISISLGDIIEIGTIYEVTISGIADCVGNTMVGEATESFALPEPPEQGDLLINEVLFNPFTGGSDFVEVVNVSSKAISLKDMVLQNATLTTKTITTEPVLLFPGQYVVFTPDPENLILEYPLGKRENFLYVESLPSYANTSGSVILADALGQVFDRFDYQESYQFPLLVTYKGVSLERMSFTRPTNDPSNWSSASEQVGFATPGYLNSQYLPENVVSSVTFELQKEVFSPDNDGFEDVLYINYRMDEPGFVATIRVFDRYGRLVRTLTNNLLLGTTGTIAWDGITDDRAKARIGPHIIYIESFRPEGRVETFKIPCIVAGRLSQ